MDPECIPVIFSNLADNLPRWDINHAHTVLSKYDFYFETFQTVKYDDMLSISKKIKSVSKYCSSPC